MPCVHADMYYMCERVVGMDVEFEKLVYGGHSLEADRSRRGVDFFLFFKKVGRKCV